MNKKPTKLSLVIFIVLVITVVFGINIANVKTPLTGTSQCLLSNNTCVFGSVSLDLGIVFAQTPVVEEELLIDFTLLGEFSINAAWIEGINMYMGKTPVIIEPSKNKSKRRGITFLGSCSEPVMQWQLFVELENNNTEQTIVYSVLFTTRPE